MRSARFIRKSSPGGFSAATEAELLRQCRAPRRITWCDDRVIGRQLPAGEIGRTLETMLEAQMTPQRPTAKPALQADHVIWPNRLSYRHSRRQGFDRRRTFFQAAHRLMH